MTWLPSLDGQTVVAIVIGAVISLITYWLTQKKARTAEIERVENCNSELVGICIDILAIERIAINKSEYELIKNGKALSAGISQQYLYGYNDAISRAYYEIISSKFVTPDDRITIRNLINANETIVGEQSIEEIDLESRRKSIEKVNTFASFSISSGIVSITVGFMTAIYYYESNPQLIQIIGSFGRGGLIGAGIGFIILIIFIYYFDKNFLSRKLFR